jgi:hypothetical protein
VIGPGFGKTFGRRNEAEKIGLRTLWRLGADLDTVGESFGGVARVGRRLKQARD